MADLSFHHGTRLSESNETPVLVKIAQTAVVALIGTAPDADSEVFPLDTPVLLKGSADKAAKLGSKGTLKDGVDDVFDQVQPYMIIIRVKEGESRSATLTNLVGDVTKKTGVHALLKAESSLGIKPRIIAIPGFSDSNKKTANPVVAELAGILEELKAFAYIDGPDTTDEAAVDACKKISSGRFEFVDPKCLVWDAKTNKFIGRPASARFAGLRARIDLESGFWHSSSNKPIFGIGGVTRPISYGKQSDYLNENKVSTILNTGNGYISWGNRCTSGDDLWSFTCVRRTADFINEAIQKAYLEFVDKPFSKANIKLLLESGNAAMRTFIAEGAIIGGKVWMQEDLNEPTQLAGGRITLSLDFEPPAPMEDIRFIAHRNIEYYLELTKSALKAI